MRKAVIDLGTNTFHLIIADILDGEIQVLYKNQIAVKLGEKGINQGEIAPAAFERGLNALREFRKDLDSFNPSEITAVATSAIRSAANGSSFTGQVLTETGIRIQVIDGNTEAELIFKGVSATLPSLEAPFMVMDIGGGSVEFIIGTNTGILWKQSFEIGCARLVELYHKNDPISAEEVNALETFLETALKPLREQFVKTPFSTLVGSAGSFESIAEIIESENNSDGEPRPASYEFIPVEAYLDLHHKLLKSTLAERIKMPALADYRVEMIVVASILIHHIIKTFKTPQVICSMSSLKEGVLLTGPGL